MAYYTVLPHMYHYIMRCFQVPALSIFESSLRRGKFDANRKLSNGGMMEFSNIYPMDAVYDTPEDVPEDVNTLIT